jgi:hypothetical protein
MTAMLSFRAYFLTASDHIRHVAGFEAGDDVSACAQADLMLSQSDYAAIEVYQGWRLVRRSERVQRAA